MENLDAGGHIVDLVTEELSSNSLNVFLLLVVVLVVLALPLAERSALKIAMSDSSQPMRICKATWNRTPERLIRPPTGFFLLGLEQGKMRWY